MESERPVSEESTSGWLSLDWLNVNGLETCRLDTAFHREKEEKEGALQRQNGKDEEEEIVVKDEQVADFASSVLAAISCWRYKARALLFTRVATVRLTVICFFPFLPLLVHIAPLLCAEQPFQSYSSLFHSASGVYGMVLSFALAWLCACLISFKDLQQLFLRHDHF